jgi:hypothetical protein
MIKLIIVIRGDFIEIRPHQQGKSMGPNGRALRNEAPPPQNDRQPEENTADPKPGARLRPDERSNQEGNLEEDKARLEGKEDSIEWKIPPGMPPLY